MTDELYKNIEAGQAGLLNIINNFFEKIGTEPNLGGSINELEYFEPNNKLLVEMLQTPVVSEADRDYESDYGHDYKRYVAVESGSEKVHFIDSSSFGYSDIPKFVGDSIFQKQIFPNFLVVIVDRQYHDPEEWPRYDIEIHKVNQKHLEEYFEKKLAEAAKELKSNSLNLNWFSRSLIKNNLAGNYNILNRLESNKLYCIDKAKIVRVNNYFFLKQILLRKIEENPYYYFGSNISNPAYELGGRNIGYRIFSDNLAGNLIVIATPTGNLDRNGCWGKKYSITIYVVNQNHLVDLYNQKKAIADGLPNVTLSDLVRSADSTRKFLYKYSNVFIRTGQFYSYGFDASPSFEFINSKYDTVYDYEDKTVSYEDYNYEREERFDNEKFERALKNVVGDRFSHQGYSHRAVVWALYNQEKVPEGWTLPKVIQ